jgi:hypothetical protein
MKKILTWFKRERSNLTWMPEEVCSFYHLSVNNLTSKNAWVPPTVVVVFPVEDSNFSFVVNSTLELEVKRRRR